MRLSLTLAVVAAAGLLPFGAAFTDTAPFLAFSSRQSSLLDSKLMSRSAPSPAVVPRDISQSMTSKVDELCGLDAMAIVEVESVSGWISSLSPRGITHSLPFFPLNTAQSSCFSSVAK